MKDEPLSGSALRRAVCEAVGWAIVQQLDYATLLSQMNEIRGKIFGSKSDVLNLEYLVNCMPKYESDATLSEALLDEKCRENGFWEWRVQVASHRKGYACTIWGGPDGKVVAHADGKDPSEARMRAILEALMSTK